MELVIRYKTTLDLQPKTKPVEKETDSLPTVCTNAQHPETHVKARVIHLPPALQRRGDGLPASEETDETKKGESIRKEKNINPLTPKRRDAESKAGDTELEKTLHPRIKSQLFTAGKKARTPETETGRMN
ncbi:hypothetical protein HID58_000864 [Brassica napus]|uniref:Uncharacterized protein n=1 Tax=Brassica napus TaxID=3708 RepID=A0ABQ8EIT6_BRANA|nr:hypothetical protein HID58_000864 [Brassica napus]